MVSVEKKKRKIKLHIPNEGNLFWDRMSEAEKQRFAESYMEFLEYRQCGI